LGSTPFENWPMLFKPSILLALAGLVLGKPNLEIVDDETSIIDNGDGFQMTINSTSGYGYSIKDGESELVGSAVGAYVDTGGKQTFNFTKPQIEQSNDDLIDVKYSAVEGDVHYVFQSGLRGFYSYVVTRDFPTAGEFRSLLRLNPDIFTWGRNNEVDAPLPLIEDIENGYKVQDETFQRSNGSFITKYDFSAFVRDLDFHGVHGDGHGAWLISPSKDYYVGDQLKQELMIHRESATNDAVLLNMVHGTHLCAEFSEEIPQGKIWGPWLFYFNDGDLDDVSKRVKEEDKKWPYKWLKDEKYHDRGNVKGQILLEDGTPASGAAVFLGEPGRTVSQGAHYQYTGYADEEGNFEFKNVRREKEYALQAWASNKSDKLRNVSTVFEKNNITIEKNTNLGKLKWELPKDRSPVWQIGAFDRLSDGFKNSDKPRVHGLSDESPAYLYYSIGVNEEKDWYYAQSAEGNWTVLFDVDTTDKDAVISASFAGYTAIARDDVNSGAVPVTLSLHMNGQPIGNISDDKAADSALYRSANRAGGYYYNELTVPSDTLLEGTNRLDLVLINGARWKGIIWDAIKLELMN
jgi:rhamnogalacturonan endolyase